MYCHVSSVQQEHSSAEIGNVCICTCLIDQHLRHQALRAGQVEKLFGDIQWSYDHFGFIHHDVLNGFCLECRCKREDGNGSFCFSYLSLSF